MSASIPNILLGVNIDHIATLRQQRGTPYPEVIAFAALAQQAGADTITVHLREDRRHIHDKDVSELVSRVDKVNLEMAARPEMIQLALGWRPASCCLVPERREELTTEGGLNVLGDLTTLTDCVHQLQDAGISVALFIEPDHAQIDAAVATGASMIELHTGRFANTSGQERTAELNCLRESAFYAHSKKLQVNAGHGLHLQNVGDIAAILAITELNIGHSLVCDALYAGLPQAVQQMKHTMQQARLISLLHSQRG